ncbi:MAG: HAMP domain-containing sensor histidine kinase [bacterium]|nr:HAMP domain-containing sensor histidine kinase [bacterium]
MKMRAKLFIAFILVIILPIGLITCVGTGIIHYQVESIQRSYDVNSDTLDVIQNPIHILNGVTRGVYNEIKLLAIKDPDKLCDKSYLEKINGDLLTKYSFLIVEQQGETIYCGNPKQAILMQDSLPQFGDNTANVDGGVYVGGQESFLIKQQDFYSNNKECSIYVVTDVNTMVPQIKDFAIEICVAFFIIICLTSTLITGWLYRCMIRPLNKLRIATQRMKEGDLNYSVMSEKTDEIGLLCGDFEEMRLRLKTLIDTKLQYEQESKELISNISHDLKTPLTAIKGYTEGILDGVADTDEKREKYLKTIYTKANDMTMLVDELSLYTKLDTNTIPYNFVTVNLNQYFADCISELSLDLEVKNIDLGYFNYASHEIDVIIDPEQIKRVINNIVGNAVKYMDKRRGIINIRIHENEDTVVIEIEDNGKGIAEKDLPYIFDRFYRADASRNSSTGGTGLGLAIAKKIVEEHNGSIWAKSKENIGTIFYMSLKKEMEIDEQDINH